MKRVPIFLLLLIACFSTQVYSMGTIHLFADTTSLSISSDISEYETMNIWIAYTPTNGDSIQCIGGLEFSVHWDSPYIVESGPPVIIDAPVPPLGNIRTGIAIALGDARLWISEGYGFIGYFPVLALQDIIAGSEPIILSVEAETTGFNDTPIIADCTDPLHPVREVKGGKFVFPYEAHVIGVESKSWGAIKSLIK